MSIDFIHLCVHSEFSLVDGLCRHKSLMKKLTSINMPAVAITDRANLFGMIRYYKQATANGVKAIAAADVLIMLDEDPKEHTRYVLLCQNDQGYRSLTKLISRAYVEGKRIEIPLLNKAWLDAESCEGLIAIAMGQESDIGNALLDGNQADATAILAHWQAIFPNRYYVGVSRVGKPYEEALIQALIPFSQQHHLPLVAHNDVCFVEKDDFEAHEARVCIHDGFQISDPRRVKKHTTEQYFKTAEEMCQLFADIPAALTNTVEIAKRCNLTLSLGKPCLPKFPTPDGLEESDYLRQLSKEGLEKRLAILFREGVKPPLYPKEDYYKRLEIELDVIISMGFSGYFLIVADFIAWGKNNQVPVGPGRGSGAGSLVAYALDITDLDPLAYDLLFERFLNPERVSMPDFDIDFCMDKRDQVIDYVAKQYGQMSVSQIITFGTMAAKAVIRDVGRVLGHPYGFVDKIAKLIPFEIGITLDKALAEEEALKKRYDEEEEVKALIDLARKLEGVTRNAGKHAGGVVISPSLLTDFTPIYCEEGKTQLVSQYDKDDVEAAGLVKFDFLGLRTLTIIDWALQNVEKQTAEKIDINLIPLDDPKTFALLKACQTTAIFQLESRGMKDLIKRLQPDCFEDIVALVALFRPGPLQSGMVDDFINRKHGRAAVEYPHPDLEPILKPTYGVILYQEQVMQIAQVLAGYTLGGADLLRRAMGKKKPEEMAKQRVIFTEGAVKRGVEEDTATYIFDLMEKFAGYGFNKSHSAAYALVSYQTAWLKAHYPAPFMAAVLSSDMDNTDKVVMLIEECRQMGLTVTSPDVNQSFYKFTVAQNNDVVYGLGAVKGVGEQALQSVIESRQQAGPYASIFDFCQRIDLKKMNRRTMEALIKAGCMDGMGSHRNATMCSLDSAIQGAGQISLSASQGQADLFGNQLIEAEEVDVPEWSEQQRLQGEKETLGLYLTGHPYRQYHKELKQFVSNRLKQVRPEKNKKILLAGIVIAVRAVKTKTGKRMAIVTLDDQSARLEVTLFNDTYEANRDKVVTDNLLIVKGEAKIDDFSGNTRITASEVYTYNEAREQFARRLCLTIKQDQADADFIESLKRLLTPYQNGDCPLFIDYIRSDARMRIRTGIDWQLSLDDALFERLQHFIPDGVSLEY